MNKRILQLAEQAGFYVANNKIYIPTTSEEITTYQTRFTELIVKECLHIVDDEGAGEGGCIRAMIRIQEEFGIEE